MMRRGQAPDRGSASIWVLACAVIVLLVGVLATLRSGAVLARHRAESAADLAALAAAGRIGLGTDGCAVARSVAAANGASLARCRLVLDPDGRSGTVDVAVTLAVHLPGVGSQRVLATARAGRLPVQDWVGLRSSGCGTMTSGCRSSQSWRLRGAVSGIGPSRGNKE
ncbi:MAG TPA: Rv3654c family TadE-like protein [Jatrophihabitantaceae bacterium]|jgi:secretion/DNA translocation related TadE-like protein